MARPDSTQVAVSPEQTVYLALAVAATPFVLLIVAFWRMGTAQHRIANKLDRLSLEVSRLGHGPDAAPSPAVERPAEPVRPRRAPQGSIAAGKGLMAGGAALVLVGGLGAFFANAGLGGLITAGAGVLLLFVGGFQYSK